LSPLSNDPAFALAFRTLQPMPEQPVSLLVLLHGVGSNESHLAALGAEVASETLVVLSRGPITLGPGDKPGAARKRVFSRLWNAQPSTVASPLR
jgi:predicted esterase